MCYCFVKHCTIDIVWFYNPIVVYTTREIMYKLVVMQVLSTVLIDGGSANCVLRDLFEIV